MDNFVAALTDFFFLVNSRFCFRNVVYFDWIFRINQKEGGREREYTIAHFPSSQLQQQNSRSAIKIELNKWTSAAIGCLVGRLAGLD